jgi:hypothetical protein
VGVVVDVASAGRVVVVSAGASDTAGGSAVRAEAVVAGVFRSWSSPLSEPLLSRL